MTDKFLALFKPTAQSPLSVNEDTAFIVSEVSNMPVNLMEPTDEEAEIMQSQKFNSEAATKRANNFAQYGQERAPNARGRGRGQRGGRGGNNRNNNNTRRRNDDLWDDPSSGGGHFQNGVFTTNGGQQSTAMWHYKDPQGEVQGPFPAAEMTDWFEAGYFAGNLLVRRADVEEDFHASKGWMELAEYMRHLNALTGKHVGVTFFGPPLIKPKSPEVAISPVERQANWQQPQVPVVPSAKWQQPIEQQVAGLQVHDRQWQSQTQTQTHAQTAHTQAQAQSHAQSHAHTQAQVQTHSQPQKAAPQAQIKPQQPKQTQQVQPEQPKVDYLRDARKTLEPLHKKIDVRALLDLLSVMTDPESIVEIVHDAIGPHFKIVDPQLVAEQVIKARNPNAKVPKAPASSAQQVDLRQPVQKDAGFTEVLSKKKLKGRKQSADQPVVGLNGREVVGATGYKK